MTETTKTVEQKLVAELIKKPIYICMNCRWKGVEVRNSFVMVCTAEKDTPIVAPDHTCGGWREIVRYD